MTLSRKATFTGSQGEELAALMEFPEAGAPHAFALFAHCFTCSKDSVAASRVSRALAAMGVATLRFDFTGLGSSQGDFANTNFSSNVADLLHAVSHLREAYQAPSILIGHSLGGAAVLAAAGQVPEAKAVVTIGAPADPAHVQHNFAAAVPEIEARGEAVVDLGGRPFRIKKQFLEDIEDQKLEQAIAGMDKALLVFHAPRDSYVGIENAERIYRAAKHPKSFVTLDDADHLLLKREDGKYVAKVIAAWVQRYLPKAAPPEPLPENVVEVQETGGGRFAQTVRVGDHILPADEPRSIEGGTDTGPSPYDLLLAGLGACTSMTLRMYADRKGLPLDKVAVRLKHKKIHAQDCLTCETEAGRIDHIERDLILTGDLDAGQRTRLLEIADKCPVHRTLESEVKIDTSLDPA